ncbi:MAG: hypothetical protein DHS20C15_04120 [Planctomycetota bacterium]|nr:MAG: hypothetical protein DHS20C15_04120 [Planctomycetota bacterium]
MGTLDRLSRSLLNELMVAALSFLSAPHRLRAGAWIALVAFLAGWFAPQWHHMESHSWCATHGVLEHADAAGPEEHGAAPREAANTVPAAVVGVPGLRAESSSDAEAHSTACALAFASRPKGSSAPDEASSFVVRPRGAQLVLRASTAPARRIAVLRQSPKTSPPRVS